MVVKLQQETFAPVTLGHIRSHGCRDLLVNCISGRCHHSATLNGDWTISVTDLWPIDAGKLHDWTIAFNPAIVQDCSGPVIQ